MSSSESKSDYGGSVSDPQKSKGKSKKSVNKTVRWIEARQSRKDQESKSSEESNLYQSSHSSESSTEKRN